MELVITPNIVLQALGGQEHVRRLVVHATALDLKLWAPEDMRHEIKATVENWVRAGYSTRETYLEEAAALFQNITFTALNQYEAFLPQAISFTVLPRYAAYVALAMALSAAGVWCDAPEVVRKDAPVKFFSSLVLSQEIPEAQLVLALESQTVLEEQTLVPPEVQIPPEVGGAPASFDPIRDATVTPEYVTNYLTHLGLKCIYDDDQDPQPRYFLNLSPEDATPIRQPLPSLQDLPEGAPAQFIEVIFDPEDRAPEELTYVPVDVRNLIKYPDRPQEYWQFFIAESEFRAGRYTTINSNLDKEVSVKVYFDGVPPANPPPEEWPMSAQPQPPPSEVHIAFTPEQAGFTGFNPSYQPPITAEQAEDLHGLRRKDLIEHRRLLRVGLDKMFDVSVLKITLNAKENGRLDALRNLDFNK